MKGMLRWKRRKKRDGKKTSFRPMEKGTPGYASEKRGLILLSKEEES